MAPTTLPGQVTTTTPYGRNTKIAGNALKITDLISLLPGAYYVTRQSHDTHLAVRKLKKAIRNAFEYQKLNKGTCFIEVVSNCPSGWKMTPLESLKFMEEEMFKFYPLGDLKVPPKD
jgi:2-oxoglutarate ferredoxin oxidoreductase subunit beta